MYIYYHWWYTLVILFILPFIYDAFRNAQNSWDFRLDVAAVFLVTWTAGITYILTKIF